MGVCVVVLRKHHCVYFAKNCSVITTECVQNLHPICKKMLRMFTSLSLFQCFIIISFDIIVFSVIVLAKLLKMTDGRALRIIVLLLSQ